MNQEAVTDWSMSCQNGTKCHQISNILLFSSHYNKLDLSSYGMSRISYYICGVVLSQIMQENLQVKSNNERLFYILHNLQINKTINKRH